MGCVRSTCIVYANKEALMFQRLDELQTGSLYILTGLAELKQAGFHVVVIGHLARKYRAQENGLQDEGLRVLADEQIAYEADAILLVEREGDERAITPIIKPPRPAHLKINKRYTATLGTLYPDQVPDGDAKTKGRAGDKSAGRP